MCRSIKCALLPGVIVGLLCNLLAYTPALAQRNLEDVDCANPQDSVEQACCNALSQMGPEMGVTTCRGMGFKVPAEMEPQPSAKEMKFREITAQCDEFADQMGWHQSDAEREAAATRCRRKPDEFLGSDASKALHGYWLSSSILQCDPGYIAQDRDCVRLPEREGGTWSQGGRLGCDKNKLYILVADKRGVTNARDLDDLAPEQQKCLKLREPRTSKRMTSTDQIMRAMSPTVNCPSGYQYIRTMDICALQ